MEEADTCTMTTVYLDHYGYLLSEIDPIVVNPPIDECCVAGFDESLDSNAQLELL